MVNLRNWECSSAGRMLACVMPRFDPKHGIKPGQVVEAGRSEIQGHPWGHIVTEAAWLA